LIRISDERANGHFHTGTVGAHGIVQGYVRFLRLQNSTKVCALGPILGVIEGSSSINSVWA
jgi:hypothetical protein